MKFSFQTVWILFGVTLAHLFVISALTPIGKAGRNSLAQEISAMAGTGAAPAVTTATPLESPPQAEVAEKTGGEIASSPSATEEPSASSAPAAVVNSPPSETLVETTTGERPAVPVDPPALSSPPRVIREIRDLKPLRRS